MNEGRGDQHCDGEDLVHDEAPTVIGARGSPAGRATTGRARHAARTRRPVRWRSAACSASTMPGVPQLAVTISWKVGVAVVEDVKSSEALDRDERGPRQQQVGQQVIIALPWQEAKVDGVMGQDGQRMLAGADEGNDDEVDQWVAQPGGNGAGGGDGDPLECDRAQRHRDPGLRVLTDHGRREPIGDLLKAVMGMFMLSGTCPADA
jgi:hypothetical protein